MKKEDKKKRILQNEDQGEVSKNSESGFVYEFFISEDEKGQTAESQINKQLKEKRKKQSKHKDQSEAFFLPDLDTHDD